MKLISVNPDPIHPGEGFTVCYDFGHGDPTPARLRIDWSPQSLQDQVVEVTYENNCTVVECPAGATGLIIEDLTGTGDDVAPGVQP